LLAVAGQHSYEKECQEGDIFLHIHLIFSNS
jgi:hypothetical protein